MISKLLKHLQTQKGLCFILVPDIWAPWRTLLKQYSLASIVISQAFDSIAFTITEKRVPKLYPQAMLAAYVSFE
jgi:hypothetical protein